MSMIDMFLKGVGFDPAEFAQACEYYKKEFELMKSGLQGAVGHFNGELVAIRKENAELHAKVDRLMLLLEAVTFSNFSTETKLQEIKLNGHDHERTEHVGSQSVAGERG